jgi:hypothetical protein
MVDGLTAGDPLFIVVITLSLSKFGTAKRFQAA